MAKTKELPEIALDAGGDLADCQARRTINNLFTSDNTVAAINRKVSQFLDENPTWAAEIAVIDYTDKLMRQRVEYDQKGGQDVQLPIVKGPEVKTLSEVKAEAISWLWEPYIPFGKLTLFEGDPGVGKSWVSLAIATAMSLGTGLPGKPELTNGPVLIASAEDGIADTIKPRLTAMHADQTAIHAIDGLLTLDEKGFDMLDNYVADYVPALLIIDPLVAYLSGDMDINKANQVRFATARLAALADKWGTAILAVRHLTKGNSTKAIYRGLGSIDFTAAARSVLFAGSNPDNDQDRAIDHIKSNLAIKGSPIGYELREGGFYWKETTELNYDKMTSTSEERGALDEAKDFLRDTLSDGSMLAIEVTRIAENNGITKSTLRRAREELNIKPFRQGELGVKGGGKWFWKMPDF